MRSSFYWISSSKSVFKKCVGISSLVFQTISKSTVKLILFFKFELNCIFDWRNSFCTKFNLCKGIWIQIENVFRMLLKIKNLIVVKLKGLKSKVKTVYLWRLFMSCSQREHFFDNLVNQPIFTFIKLILFRRIQS